MRRSGLTRRLLVTVSVAAMTALLCQPAAAANLQVSNSNDTGAGSLRDAINNSASGDTVDLSPGLTGTVTLGSDLTVTHSLTVDVNDNGGRLDIAGPHGITFTTGNTSINGGFLTYTSATSLQGGTLSINGNLGWSADSSPLVMSGGT